MPPTQLNDSTSIYLQIAGMIEENILRGILLEGEQAPSTNELARLYSINPATAAKGLNLLADSGILYKKRGLGMFVQTGAKAQIQTNRKNSFYTQFVQPLAAEAKNIGLTAPDVAQMLQKALEEEPGQ